VRVQKPGTAAASFTIQATSSGKTATATFTIPTGDPRSGEYKVFAANGTEYTLALDLDAAQYTLLQGSTLVGLGTFVLGGDGTYRFLIGGYTPVSNSARFRIGNGVIVGAHPLFGSQAVPFIAANNFVTSAADLPTTNLWMF